MILFIEQTNKGQNITDKCNAVWKYLAHPLIAICNNELIYLKIIFFINNNKKQFNCTLFKVL